MKLNHKIFKSVLLIFLGYSIAVISFRRDLLIDYPSQNYSIKYKIFPFSRTEELPHNYFTFYFNLDKHAKNTYQDYINTISMFPFEFRYITTEGQFHTRAMGYFTRLDAECNLTNEERDFIASNFCYLVETRGTVGASSYAMHLWRERVNYWNFTNDVLKYDKMDLSIPDDL